MATAWTERFWLNKSIWLHAWSENWLNDWLIYRVLNLRVGWAGDILCEQLTCMLIDLLTGWSIDGLLFKGFMFGQVFLTSSCPSHIPAENLSWRYFVFDWLAD